MEYLLWERVTENLYTNVNTFAVFPLACHQVVFAHPETFQLTGYMVDLLVTTKVVTVNRAL